MAKKFIEPNLLKVPMDNWPTKCSPRVNILSNPSIIDAFLKTSKAIKDSGVPREEIFLNTKIYNSCYSPKLVKLQLEKSLEGKFILSIL